MTLGRTAAGAIKIKTDGGLRAVECACCGGGCDFTISAEDADFLLSLPSSVNVDTPLYSGAISIENGTVLTNFGDGTPWEIYFITYFGEWKNTLSDQSCTTCYYDYYDEQGNGIGSPVYCNPNDYREVGEYGVFDAGITLYRDITGTEIPYINLNAGRITLKTSYFTGGSCEDFEENVVTYRIQNCVEYPDNGIPAKEFLNAIFNAAGGQNLWTTA